MTDGGFGWRWLVAFAAGGVIIAATLTTLYVDRSAPAKFVGGWVESPDMPVAGGSADLIPTLKPGLKAGRVCRVLEWYRPASSTVTGHFVDECEVEKKIEHMDVDSPTEMGLKPPRCRDIDVPELRNGEVRYVVDVAFKPAVIGHLIPIEVKAPVLKFNLTGSRKTSCAP